MNAKTILNTKKPILCLALFMALIALYMVCPAFHTAAQALDASEPPTTTTTSIIGGTSTTTSGRSTTTTTQPTTTTTTAQPTTTTAAQSIISTTVVQPAVTTTAAVLPPTATTTVADPPATTAAAKPTTTTTTAAPIAKPTLHVPVLPPSGGTVTEVLDQTENGSFSELTDEILAALPEEHPLAKMRNLVTIEDAAIPLGASVNLGVEMCMHFGEGKE